MKEEKERLEQMAEKVRIFDKITSSVIFTLYRIFHQYIYNLQLPHLDVV